jgi:hypothetical protein
MTTAHQDRLVLNVIGAGAALVALVELFYLLPLGR